MTPMVQWRLLFRVANRTAFDRCLARTLQQLDAGRAVGAGRPYWKSPELWECAVASPVAGRAAAEQVIGCLLEAQRLASGWYIFGTLSANNAEGFSGVFDTRQNGSASKVPGLEWASFELVSGDAEPNAAPDGGSHGFPE